MKSGSLRGRRRRFRRGPRPLQHPVFRRVLGVSVFGHLVRFVDFTVTAWLIVQQTDNSTAVGLLVFFRIIPFLVFGPFLGDLLDRFPRSNVFRSTQLGLSILGVGFAISVFAGLATPTVIYLYTFLVGSMMMAEIPSRRAYISSIIGPAALGSALALEMVSLNLAWFVGSNFGGGIVRFVDPEYAYFAIGLTYSANFISLRNLPAMFRARTAEPRTNLITTISEGFRFASSNPAIFACLLVVGVNNFFGYAFESMAPAFASNVYEAGPTEFGFLMSAQGFGALGTAFYISLRGRRIRNPGLLLLAAAMIQAIGSIGFSYTTTVSAGFAAIAALGLISTVFGITHTLLILTLTPMNMRGRVMGFQVLMMGFYPLGSLALGIVGDAIGLGQAVRVFALIGLALFAIIWVRYPVLRKLPG
ncbi:MAG TPA: MFS transporter [Dehalococcoidia bacterium]|nr:MFS transporter [Dehalococcoidia bacterium]